MTHGELTRFNAKFDVDSHGCWLWTGCIGSARPGEEGYGQFRCGKKTRRAHRVAYEHFIGTIPEGLVIDHLCRVRRCVNPLHMEVVTHRENILRGASVVARHAESTHCPRGHRYDMLRERLDRNGSIERGCRICARESWANYKRRIRAEQAA